MDAQAGDKVHQADFLQDEVGIKLGTERKLTQQSVEYVENV